MTSDTLRELVDVRAFMVQNVSDAAVAVRG